MRASPSSATPAPQASPTPARRSPPPPSKPEFDVFPIPGANAAISALIASGLSGRALHLPRLPSRQRRPAAVLRSNNSPRPARPIVFYEAPHRILEHAGRCRVDLRPHAARRRRARADEAARGVSAWTGRREFAATRIARRAFEARSSCSSPCTESESRDYIEDPQHRRRVAALMHSEESARWTPSSASPASAALARARPTANSSANNHACDESRPPSTAVHSRRKLSTARLSKAGQAGKGLLPTLHPVVVVDVARRSQRLVIQVRRTDRQLQLFGELVERAQMVRRRRNLRLARLAGTSDIPDRPASRSLRSAAIPAA